MTKGFFITGTDTEVGKTWCTVGIMENLQQQGYSVVGMKPVASGCTETTDGLRNEDALMIQQQSSIPLDYKNINPYSFAPAIAPHIAAQQVNQPIELNTITDAFSRLKQQSDMVVVEGVGGWLVPLNDNETIVDLAQALELPVILIVGLRLGCINHALLTAESIRQSGCNLVGWIANTLDEKMAEKEQTIDSIEKRIDAPLLGVVPHLSSLQAGTIAGHLNTIPLA